MHLRRPAGQLNSGCKQCHVEQILDWLGFDAQVAACLKEVICSDVKHHCVLTRNDLKGGPSNCEKAQIVQALRQFRYAASKRVSA